jgi:hypothetical protein
MDIASARLLVESLLERTDLDSATGKLKLGFISSNEKLALEALMSRDFDQAPSAFVADAIPPLSIPRAPTLPPVALFPDAVPRVTAAACAPDISLNLSALERTEAENTNVTMCLDFGTAMSKAFAIEGDNKAIELALGERAGSSGYPVESSLFISDDGILYFGPQAVELGTAAAALGRLRFDSPKSRLSMGQQVDIHRAPIGKAINPISSIPVTEGELITLYLGYLTDLATSELEARGYSRYCARRFARPCWSEDRNKWAEPLLRRMLAQAQVLADTFHDRWQGGIPLVEAKLAIEKLRELAALPDYLLNQGVPEPVAAAASLMLTDEAQRELFLVVDVGAGTTDFGLFLLQHNPDKEVCVVRIVPNTIRVLEQAGNRVDDLLKFYVLDQEGIDKSSPEGEHDLRYMQSSIRIHKEALFRDGVVEVPLANRSRAVIILDEFLDSSRVKAFGQLLKQEALEVLKAAGDGYLGIAEEGRLNVVLTGGGADLPMVQKLAVELVEVRGFHILPRAVPHVPHWISEEYPQFAPQYPQLAVAIGGANPELPIMAESVADFLGLRNPTYTA